MANKEGVEFGEYDFVHGSGFAPALESADVVSVRGRYGIFVGGEFVNADGGGCFETVNPATGDVLAEVAEGGMADVDAAVKAARKAYEGAWGKIDGAERGKYLFRIARLLQERAREFAVLETLDGGKPIRESRDIDIPMAAAHFFYHAGWADKLEYAFPGRCSNSLGVVGQVIPWNFPLLMAAWKIAPALACGNTVVLKPAETTPLTALLLAEVCVDAGMPAGVVNIVTGGAEAGKSIVEHEGIDKVAFTGSTTVGKGIQRAMARTGKRYTLELGGKAAHIIFEDAAVNQAVEGIVNGIFFNQGHVCCAGSRLLVQEGIADEVVKKLKRRIGTLVVGNPMDKNTDVGAINSKDQHERISDYLRVAEDEGASVWRADLAEREKGFFHAPALITDCAQSHRAVQEEIFGPVLTIQTFRTPAEAIEKANNTPFGLSGGVWTEKGSKVFKVTDAVEAGVMWANTYHKFDPTSPFGGFKESGVGREGGLHGLMEYRELV